MFLSITSIGVNLKQNSLTQCVLAEMGFWIFNDKAFFFLLA